MTAKPDTTRRLLHIYRDPLDVIWETTLRRMGLRLGRSSEVFASVGDGVVTLGTPETLDPDDCVAQMVFHELCHSMVQGVDAWTRPDWGLDNETLVDDVRERACLRLQAALLQPYGLRRVLAPTTDYREVYDQLPSDPLGADEPDAELARRAMPRIDEPPWAPHVRAALRATASIVRIAQGFADDSHLYAVLEDEVSDPSRGRGSP